jgi:hypothetical protein
MSNLDTQLQTTAAITKIVLFLGLGELQELETDLIKAFVYYNIVLSADYKADVTGVLTRLDVHQMVIVEVKSPLGFN